MLQMEMAVVQRQNGTVAVVLEMKSLCQKWTLLESKYILHYNKILIQKFTISSHLMFISLFSLAIDKIFGFSSWNSPVNANNKMFFFWKFIIFASKTFQMFYFLLTNSMVTSIKHKETTGRIYSSFKISRANGNIKTNTSRSSKKQSGRQSSQWTLTKKR